MRTRMLICIVLCFCLFLGCSKNNIEKGLNCNVEGIPALSGLSSSADGTVECYFPLIRSATYRDNGIEKSVATEDPRLVCFLNFLAYSNEHNLSVWQQGYVAEDEVEKYLATNDPLLIIEFSTNNSDCSIAKNIDALIVCGDSYLTIATAGNDEPNQERIVERWWPYGELIMEKIAHGEADSNMISYNGWGSNYWIDLLEYAGF